MVGAMKLFAPPPPPPTPLERTLCVLAGSRGSFSFSAQKGRGEARPLPFLQTEELLCGESASESPPKSVRNQQIGVENEGGSHESRRGEEDVHTERGRGGPEGAGVGAPPEAAARPRRRARGRGPRRRNRHPGLLRALDLGRGGVGYGEGSREDAEILGEK
jgi:hypothetical protein